jgi:hypothetical protein
MLVPTRRTAYLAPIHPSKGETGTVRRELRDAALDTVKKWIYRPATRVGVPLRMYLLVPVTFCPRNPDSGNRRG